MAEREQFSNSLEKLQSFKDLLNNMQVLQLIE